MRLPIVAGAVVAMLVLAGCTAVDRDAASPLVHVTMAPDSQVHVLLHVENVTQAAQAQLVLVEADGLDVGLPEILHNEGDAVAGWLRVQAPADAAGGHLVQLRVEAPAGFSVTVSVAVEVAAATDPLAAGEVALVDLALRAWNGTLTFTTRADVDASPLPKVAGYESPAEHEPLPLQLQPEGGLPPALIEAIVGAGIGHSGTADLGAFYGPASTESEEPREEPVERAFELERFVEPDRASAEAQGYLTAEMQVGDRLDTPGPVPYVIEALNETTLRAELDVAVGERYTFEEPWPDATEVVAVTDDEVHFRTDPPFAPGERFTWHARWPNATEVVAVEEDGIVLRHTPEVGSTYEQPGPQGQPAETTVVAVEDDRIVVSRDNPHPLAGETIFFEFTVVGRQDAPTVPGMG